MKQMWVLPGRSDFSLELWKSLFHLASPALSFGDASWHRCLRVFVPASRVLFSSRCPTFRVSLLSSTFGVCILSASSSLSFLLPHNSSSPTLLTPSHSPQSTPTDLHSSLSPNRWGWEVLQGAFSCELRG